MKIHQLDDQMSYTFYQKLMAGSHISMKFLKKN